MTGLLTEAPQDVPDVLPTASKVYARKVAKLTEALNQPEERPHASEVLRMLIEKIVLTPGPERGEIDALLYGDLGTILNWVERQAGSQNANTPGAERPGVSVSLVAGARNHLNLLFDAPRLATLSATDSKLDSQSRAVSLA